MRRSVFACSAWSTQCTSCGSPKLRQNSSSPGAAWPCVGAQAKADGASKLDSCVRLAACAPPGRVATASAIYSAREGLSMDHLRGGRRVRDQRTAGQLAQAHVEHGRQEQPEQGDAEHAREY